MDSQQDLITDHRKYIDVYMLHVHNYILSLNPAFMHNIIKMMLLVVILQRSSISLSLSLSHTDVVHVCDCKRNKSFKGKRIKGDGERESHERKKKVV